MEGGDAPKLPCPFITPCTTKLRMKSAVSRPCASASSASTPANWRHLCARHRHAHASASHPQHTGSGGRPGRWTQTLRPRVPWTVR